MVILFICVMNGYIYRVLNCCKCKFELKLFEILILFGYIVSLVDKKWL